MQQNSQVENICKVLRVQGHRRNPGFKWFSFEPINQLWISLRNKGLSRYEWSGPCLAIRLMSSRSNRTWRCGECEWRTCFFMNFHIRKRLIKFNFGDPRFDYFSSIQRIVQSKVRFGHARFLSPQVNQGWAPASTNSNWSKKGLRSLPRSLILRYFELYCPLYCRPSITQPLLNWQSWELSISSTASPLSECHSPIHRRRSFLTHITLPFPARPITPRPRWFEFDYPTGIPKFLRSTRKTIQILSAQLASPLV